MNKLFTILFLLFSTNVLGQKSQSLDFYSFKNGAEITVGDSLLLNSNQIKSAYLFVTSTVTDRADKEFLSTSLSNYAFKIIALRRIWWSYHDDIIYAIIENKGKKYFLNIDNALSSGELIPPIKQEREIANSKKAYLAKNGITYRVSNLIEIGKGSFPSGGFKFITLPNGIANGTAKEISSRVSGQKMTIKKIIIDKGIVYFLISDINKNEFILEVENAISNCEINPC